MSFIEIMHTYFRGEKLEALWFILPIGILLLIFGAVALKAERGGFAWGITIPCILFGLIFLVISDFGDHSFSSYNPELSFTTKSAKDTKQLSLSGVLAFSSCSSCTSWFNNHLILRFILMVPKIRYNQ